jgi:uncharacterized phage-associated protein
MNFKYNPEKTVEAAALFLKWYGKPMKYTGLIKLLYMADRIALDRLAEPITGNQYVSMDYGPVLSEVLDLLHYGPDYDKDNPWLKYISAPKNYTVELLNDPGVDELCEAEEDIIREVYRNYGQLDRFYLADLTHHIFPEWRNPYGSAIPIRIEDIFRALGKSEEQIEEIHRNMEQENYLDLLLNN